MQFVFWDWNGTLVDDASVLWRAFNDTVVSCGGRPVSFEQYREMYRHPISDMYREVGVDLSRYPFEVIAASWHDHYGSLVLSMQLHHDAIAILSRFQREGRRQMVVSALPRDFLVPQVKQFGVAQFFEHIEGLPNQLAHSKVQQAIELAALLDARGDDIVVIGDSSHDAEVARELGAECILVSQGAESAQRLGKHGYKVVESLREIRALPQLMRTSDVSVG